MVVLWCISGQCLWSFYGVFQVDVYGRFMVYFRSVFMGTYEAMPRERTEPKYEAVRGGATTPGSLLLATSLTFIITALSHMF